MRYANEFKVGLAIVLSVVVLFFGVRFFQDLPLFGGTYELFTAFDDARGLAAGNAVQMNGVRIGTVEEVGLDPVTHNVRVRLHVDETFQVPQGSVAVVSGLGALGGVILDIEPGPAGTSPVAPGGMIPGETGLFAQLTDRAEPLVGQVDTLLYTTNDAAQQIASTFGQADVLLRSSSDDIRATLASVRRTSSVLEQALRSEQERLTAVLTNLEQLSGSLNTSLGPEGDSLALVIRNLNQTLTQVSTSLNRLEGVSANLDSITVKINQGDGTLGRLVNDPSLYNNLDSASVNLNRLLVDFVQHPERYLRNLRLVDLF